MESYKLFKKLRASPEVAKEVGTLGREEIETGEIGDRVELSRSAMELNVKICDFLPKRDDI